MTLSLVGHCHPYRGWLFLLTATFLLFFQGFTELLPIDLIKIFDENELEVCVVYVFHIRIFPKYPNPAPFTTSSHLYFRSKNRLLLAFHHGTVVHVVMNRFLCETSAIFLYSFMPVIPQTFTKGKWGEGIKSARDSVGRWGREEFCPVSSGAHS